MYELKSQNYQNLRILQGAVYGKNDAHKVLLSPMQQEGLKIKGSKRKGRRKQHETTAHLNVGLERIKLREFLSIAQAGLLLGISRRTIYRLIDRGELNIAKYGTRSVIRKCDLESFFAVPIVEATMKPLQEFPGIDNCYNIGEIQKKFGISPAVFYLLIQRHGIAKYIIGKYTYVAKADIDTILNDARI